MPNRMLRDWTDSEAVNNLSVNAERFFVRLIMKADDFGCYHGDPRLLQSFLFPLISEKIKVVDISKYLIECENQGLISLYSVDGKKYLEIKDFRQRLRSMKSKFPRHRPSDDRHVSDDCQTSDSETPTYVSPEEEEKMEVEEEKMEEKNEGGSGETAFGYANNKLLVPQMLIKFKEFLPWYADDAALDAKALFDIAGFLCRRGNLRGDPALHAEPVMEAWEHLCVYISTDKFYKQKSLKTISNCIQEILQKALHGDQSKTTPAGGKGTAKFNDDKLKAGIRARVAERERAQGQAGTG